MLAFAVEPRFWAFSGELARSLLGRLPGYVSIRKEILNFESTISASIGTRPGAKSYFERCLNGVWKEIFWTRVC